MGYLLLLPALFCGVTKGFCGKKTSGLITNFQSASAVSLLRLFICVVFGAITLIFETNANILNMPFEITVTAIISGIFNAAVLVGWLLLAKKGALLLIDSSGMCGVFVTLILSTIFYNEPLKANHIIGMLLLITSVSMLYVYNNTIKPKLNSGTVMLLIFFALSYGIADFTQKIFNMQSNGRVSASVFNFYTYIFAFLFLGAFYLISKLFNKDKGKTATPIKKSFGYVTVMAICLYLTSFFKTLAAQRLPATHIYPLYQGTLLILCGIMAAVFFEEKITLKSIFAVIVSIIGMIIINLF